MHSRVTLLEIDTLRASVEEALELFRDRVLPDLRGREGYEGVLVLATPEGRGLIMTLWDSGEAAAATAAFAGEALERHMALFAAPPGRDHYEVVLAELPSVLLG